MAPGTLTGALHTVIAPVASAYMYEDTPLTLQVINCSMDGSVTLFVDLGGSPDTTIVQLDLDDMGRRKLRDLLA